MDDKPLVLDGLDGYQFEELIAKIMKRKGYQNIEVQPYSNDIGKDIIMEESNGDIVLVECKHQQFVGRPIVQKLQGAMSHEETHHNNKEVKGIIVTSGSFSQEAINYNKELEQKIELIDGKKLKKLCMELKIVILNGKVQIINKKSFENISEKESIDLSLKNYNKIYGSKNFKPKINTKVEYEPTAYIRYNVSFDTHTSIGCIDSYTDSGQIIMDGVDGKEIDKETSDFYFSGRFDMEDIKEKDIQKAIHYEFTENDIEEHAINSIIDEHTHSASYVGKNNVSYTKECIPKRRDIDLKEFIPIYMPLWTSETNILKMKYNQEFYVKGNNQLYLVDELRKCKICQNEEEEYKEMSICPECAKIVCHRHVRIDHLDKKTPICTIHAKPFKLFLQNKYFATKENLKKYKELWESKSFFQKLYEDKIAFGLSIAVVCGLLIVLISIVSH